MIDKRFSQNAACGIPGAQEQYGVWTIHCDPPLKPDGPSSCAALATSVPIVAILLP
jgi:hypothetical protein